MTLITKYRPKELGDIIGNKALVKSLSNVLETKEPPHAYLFSGPSGCGKTTLARIVAKELGAFDPDVPLQQNHDYEELNTASFRGIDTARDIISMLSLAPFGTRRVWLLDECHKMTDDAQEALLKALEEPPSHVYFVLATTTPAKLKDTIVNRCSHYTVRPLGENSILTLLRRVMKGEGKDPPLFALKTISKACLGSPRAALTMFNQILGVEDEETAREILERIVVSESSLLELCRALFERRGWKTVAGILRGMKDQDVEDVRRGVLGYFTTVLLSKGDEFSSIIIENFEEPFYSSGYPGLVNACFRVSPGGGNKDVPY